MIRGVILFVLLFSACSRGGGCIDPVTGEIRPFGATLRKGDAVSFCAQATTWGVR